MRGGWFCIQTKPNISSVEAGFTSVNEMNHPFWGHSPDSKFTGYDTSSKYTK